MKLHATIRYAIAAALTAAVAGCASIMSGRHAEVSIDSYPSHAHVVIRDRHGEEVASVNTPGKVTLRRKERFIFPAHYTASIEAPGYQSQVVPIRGTLNPWIFGNVVVGGIPGLIVDNVTGATWKPRDSTIFRQLQPVYAAQPTPSQPFDAPPQMAAAVSEAAAAD